jgi:uncharacterized protein
MALKANPNILECLHTPLEEHATAAGEGSVGRAPAPPLQTHLRDLQWIRDEPTQEAGQDLRARGDIKWKHAMHHAPFALGHQRFARRLTARAPGRKA